MRPKNQKTYQVGVVGCGFFGRLHLCAWQELPQVRIAAVCDADPVRAESAAAAAGVPAFTDFQSMVSHSELDFVDIATTMQSHQELTVSALSHGLPAIVQKPLAPDWESCVTIARAAHTYNLPVMVHENFRFQRPMLRVKEVLDAGEIGPPTWARISFRTAFDFYANQPYLCRQERLIALEVGVHITDLARVFLGEIREVSCMTQAINPQVAGEDQATLMCRHENGAVSVLDLSFESRPEVEPMAQTLLYLEGPRGSISMGFDYNLTIRSDDVVRHERPTPRYLGWAGPWQVGGESIFNTFEHWLHSLERGTSPVTSVQDNLKSVAAVMAAYESQRLGRHINLDHFPSPSASSLASRDM